MTNAASSQDEDDDDGPEIIYEPVRYTPYDRRREELRDLQAKRSKLDPATPAHLIAVLDRQIAQAQERFDAEKQRALDNGWRKWRGVDEWRAGAGRDKYNSSRRKVRVQPNEDLSDLTPEQKAQRRKDQRADNNWINSRRAKGWDELQIRIAFAERVANRTRQRADEAALAANPDYGRF